jgi:DNA-binding transcriptional LysR family regulator
MPRKKESRVPANERINPAALDWESARVFLEVARQKSFRAAAGVLKRSVNALRRQLDQLEHQLGATLFTRHVDGVRLTEEGQRVMEVAQRMELDAFELVRAVARTDSAAAGEVKLATTEGLGTFWIAPRLIEFHRANPRIVVDLCLATVPADVLRLEADVSIQYERPTQKDVRIVRLGRMHLMGYVGRSYAERNGVPRSNAEVVHHDIAVQAAEQLVSIEEYRQIFARGGIELGRVSTRTNLSGAHYWAIATGVGCGLLPTYVSALSNEVVPVDLEQFRAYHDIWLAYHADARRIPRVRNLIDWLIALFSPHRYPWFADDFVHPSKFPTTFEGAPSKGLLKPFMLHSRTFGS